jgi:hypothetical protein
MQMSYQTLLATGCRLEEALQEDRAVARTAVLVDSVHGAMKTVKLLLMATSFAHKQFQASVARDLQQQSSHRELASHQMVSPAQDFKEDFLQAICMAHHQQVAIGMTAKNRLAQRWLLSTQTQAPQ